jgi:DNA (cytosine-5)-methyltransferase 1
VFGNRMNLINPVPQKTHSMSNASEPNDLLKPFVTVKEAIGDLPAIQPLITTTRCDNIKHLSKEDCVKYINSENRRRFSGKEPMEYHWLDFAKHYNKSTEQGKEFLDFIKPLTKDAKLIGHTARSHQLSDIMLFEGMPEGSSSADFYDRNEAKLHDLAGLIKYKMDSFRDKYKKMAWDKPSLTVFAHLQKDGNRFIHPDSRQGRTITVREAARLQSFPDDYAFKAKGHVRYKHIGNAVPPILSMAIAKAVYRALRSCQAE